MDSIPAVLNAMEARKQECRDVLQLSGAERLEIKLHELIELDPSLSRIQAIKLYFNLK